MTGLIPILTLATVPPRLILRGWLPWMVVYCGGLAALLALFGR